MVKFQVCKCFKHAATGAFAALHIVSPCYIVGGKVADLRVYRTAARQTVGGGGLAFYRIVIPLAGGLASWRAVIRIVLRLFALLDLRFGVIFGVGALDSFRRTLIRIVAGFALRI